MCSEGNKHLNNRVNSSTRKAFQLFMLYPFKIPILPSSQMLWHFPADHLLGDLPLLEGKAGNVQAKEHELQISKLFSRITEGNKPSNLQDFQA